MRRGKRLESLGGDLFATLATAGELREASGGATLRITEGRITIIKPSTIDHVPDTLRD